MKLDYKFISLINGTNQIYSFEMITNRKSNALGRVASNYSCSKFDYTKLIDMIVVSNSPAFEVF